MYLSRSTRPCTTALAGVLVGHRPQPKPTSSLPPQLLGPLVPGFGGGRRLEREIAVQVHQRPRTAARPGLLPRRQHWLILSSSARLAADERREQCAERSDGKSSDRAVRQGMAILAGGAGRDDRRQAAILNLTRPLALRQHLAAGQGSRLDLSRRSSQQTSPHRISRIPAVAAAGATKRNRPTALGP